MCGVDLIRTRAYGSDEIYRSSIPRMRAEHPASEADHVVMRGRVLGGLEPTRAFGDARYKWDRGLQERLYDAFLPGGRASTRGPPRGLETPPYVTAQPEVEWRRLGESGGPGELRFMVMATDGLWDMLPNEEVVALVAGHLAGIRGTVLASDLSNRCFSPGRPSSPASSSAPSSSSNPSDRTADAQTQALNKPKGHPLSKGPEHLRAFTFEDENLSTHLVRNALGGADRDRVAGLLAIPSPESRRYRDDITVS